MMSSKLLLTVLVVLALAFTASAQWGMYGMGMYRPWGMGYGMYRPYGMGYGMGMYRPFGMWGKK